MIGRWVERSAVQVGWQGGRAGYSIALGRAGQGDRSFRPRPRRLPLLCIARGCTQYNSKHSTALSWQQGSSYLLLRRKTARLLLSSCPASTWASTNTSSLFQLSPGPTKSPKLEPFSETKLIEVCFSSQSGWFSGYRGRKHLPVLIILEPASLGDTHSHHPIPCFEKIWMLSQTSYTPTPRSSLCPNGHVSQRSSDQLVLPHFSLLSTLCPLATLVEPGQLIMKDKFRALYIKSNFYSQWKNTISDECSTVVR